MDAHLTNEQIVVAVNAFADRLFADSIFNKRPEGYLRSYAYDLKVAGVAAIDRTGEVVSAATAALTRAGNAFPEFGVRLGNIATFVANTLVGKTHALLPDAQQGRRLVRAARRDLFAAVALHALLRAGAPAAEEGAASSARALLKLLDEEDGTPLA